MKRLFMLATGVLALGFSSCGDNDPITEPELPISNYDGKEVTHLNLDATDLTGKWKAVDETGSITFLNGEPAPIISVNSPFEERVFWYYTFGNNSEGRGQELHHQWLRNSGYDITGEYGFTWTLSGIKLGIIGDFEELYDDEILMEFLRGAYSSLHLTDEKEILANYLLGDRSEWFVTELTSDTLVLYYRVLFSHDSFGDLYTHKWYIFEKVAE